MAGCRPLFFELTEPARDLPPSLGPSRVCESMLSDTVMDIAINSYRSYKCANFQKA